MTVFQVSLYGREQPMTAQEIMAVCSFRVLCVATLREAIAIAIEEAGEPATRWKWVFLKWPASKRLGLPVRIQAIRLVP
jgi:hypothetical protein